MLTATVTTDAHTVELKIYDTENPQDILLRAEFDPDGTHEIEKAHLLAGAIARAINQAKIEVPAK